MIATKHFILALPGLCVLVLLTPVNAHASLILNANAIVNGGAEAGVGGLLNNTVVPLVPGWTTTAGNFTVVKYRDNTDPNPGIPRFTDPGPANRGLNFFAGGPIPRESQTTFLSIGDQILDVSNAASMIDAGNLSFTLAGFLGGYLDQRDNALFTAFFNNGANTLSSVTIGPVLQADRSDMTGLLSRFATGFIPAGTRQIDFRLTLNGIDGAQNDGYADNLSFVATGPATVPEPSSAGLMAFGILAVGLSVKLRRGAAARHQA